METFSPLLTICVGNSPVPGDFPSQRQVTRSFDVFFDLRRNMRLSKQSWGWWFETLSRSLWRQCNADLHSRYTAISRRLQNVGAFVNGMIIFRCNSLTLTLLNTPFHITFQSLRYSLVEVSPSRQCLWSIEYGVKCKDSAWYKNNKWKFYHCLNKHFQVKR